MPEETILTLHYPADMVSKENMQDVIAFVNKEAKDKGSKVRTFRDLLRRYIRTYSVNSNASQRGWEANKKVAIGGEAKTVEKLRFWKGVAADIAVMDDGLEGEEFKIQIGKLQKKTLIKNLKWENTLQLEVIKDDMKVTPNIAVLVQEITLGRMIGVQAAIDLEELKLEAEDIEDPNEDEE